MVRLLKRRIEKSGSQSAFARQHKLTRSYVQYLLAGEREFGPKICEVLKAKRVLLYDVEEEVDA